MSKISAKDAHSKKKLSFPGVFITVLVVIVVLLVCVVRVEVPRERSVQVACMARLKSLGLSFKLYTMNEYLDGRKLAPIYI